MRFGHNLHRARVAKGLGQETVAYRAGLSRFTYRSYEQGKAQSQGPANPTLITVLALSQILEVPLQDLLPADVPDLTTR